MAAARFLKRKKKKKNLKTIELSQQLLAGYFFYRVQAEGVELFSIQWSLVLPYNINLQSFRQPYNMSMFFIQLTYFVTLLHFTEKIASCWIVHSHFPFLTRLVPLVVNKYLRKVTAVICNETRLMTRFQWTNLIEKFKECYATNLLINIIVKNWYLFICQQLNIKHSI